jgi:hypothetical protein
VAQYRIRVQREITEIIEAPSVDEAARVAKLMVGRDPALKLLDVIRLDKLNEVFGEGKQNDAPPQT